jgi:hypothetical protein
MFVAIENRERRFPVAVDADFRQKNDLSPLLEFPYR